MNPTQHCTGWAKGGIAPHDAFDREFSKGKTRCRSCTSAYFKAWSEAQKAKTAKTAAPQPQQAMDAAKVTAETGADVHGAPPVKVERDVLDAPKVEAPVVMAHDIGHTYRPDPKMVANWDAVVKAAEAGQHLVLALHGPQGSGKTDGAEFLAARAGRPMVKIDAKSIVDAEAWFGTRGAVEGSTFYQPSEFVKAIQMRSVVYIDEYTRVSNEVRDVLNPLMDGTRTVLNPITGERIKVHPECLIILGGNVGFKFTGTFDVDVATTSRLVVVNLGYPGPDDEAAILVEHSKIDEATAKSLVAFANEARLNPTLPNISTRELLQTSVLHAAGLDLSLAVESKIIAGASDQGDEQSARARLTTLWGGYASSGARSTAGAEDPDVTNCANCGARSVRFANCMSCNVWVA